MASQVDITKPIFGDPTTQSVRDNMVVIANEITTLQEQAVGSPFLPLAGGRMAGPMYLFNDPTDAMMPATKGYVDVHGGGSGGGGIPEAPADTSTYGRYNGAWRPVLPTQGGTLIGPLILAADPTNVLGAVTKQYADAINARILGDAPSDGVSYARRNAAWSSVLPIVGGNVTGSLGVGLTIPTAPAPFAPTLFAPQMTVAEHDFNAYRTGSTAMARLAAGTAASISLNPTTGALQLAVAANDVAGSAISWPWALTLDPLGNVTLRNGITIPSDIMSPGALSLREAIFAGVGHIAFNAYVPSPGTQWKYLAAGYAMQFFQNSTNGTVQLGVLPSGAAGGVLPAAVYFNFSPNGDFSAQGKLYGTPAIMATTSSGNGFVGSYQTAGSISNLGLWNVNNDLYFGNADGNGVPSTWRGKMNANTDFFAWNGVYCNAPNSFGFYQHPTLTERYFTFSPTWYWDWTTTTGDLSWVGGQGAKWSMRTNPDQLAWNGLGAVGGVGAYVVLSDERGKRDVSPAPAGLAEVLQLEPIIFDRIPHPRRGDLRLDGPNDEDAGWADFEIEINASLPREIGFSAQQVRQIIPDAVRVFGAVLPDGSGALDSDDPSLGITDTAILAAVVNAMKEIDARLRALEGRHHR